MRPRRCRRTCCNPGICSALRLIGLIRSSTRRKSELPSGRKRASRQRACAITIKKQSQRSSMVGLPSANRKDFAMIGYWLRAAVLVGLFASAAGPSRTANAETLALVGGNVYTSPDAGPLSGAVIVASDGVISAIGGANEVQIPKDARIIDCSGKTIVAGFWNSHVHFTQAVWRSAASGPAAPLTAHMQEMLTR